MAREMLKQAVARELTERAGNMRDALSAENILEVLADSLSLSPRQREKARPAVERLSDALAEVVDAWGEQGFIDRKALSGKLIPVLEKAEAELADVLDSEQAQALRASLARLEEDAAEVIRFSAVEMLSGRLGVTPEQAAELRPALRENLEEMSRLLHSFTAESEGTFEEFRAAFDDLRKTLRARLRKVLNDDQLKKLEALQDEVLERIRKGSFMKE